MTFYHRNATGYSVDPTLVFKPNNAAEIGVTVEPFQFLNKNHCGNPMDERFPSSTSFACFLSPQAIVAGEDFSAPGNVFRISVAVCVYELYDLV